MPPENQLTATIERIPTKSSSDRPLHSFLKFFHHFFFYRCNVRLPWNTPTTTFGMTFFKQMRQLRFRCVVNNLRSSLFFGSPAFSIFTCPFRASLFKLFHAF